MLLFCIYMTVIKVVYFFNICYHMTFQDPTLSYVTIAFISSKYGQYTKNEKKNVLLWNAFWSESFVSFPFRVGAPFILLLS
jgi:hypothetical protein